MRTMIKMGGSIITDKAQFKTPRLRVMENLCRQIRSYCPGPNESIFVCHGAGSFGHHVAKQVLALSKERQTKEMVEQVQRDVISLTDIIAKHLPKYEVLHPHAVWNDPILWPKTRGDNAQIMLHGDMVWHHNAAQVISTEEVLLRLCQDEKEPTRVLLLCDTDGVYDKTGRILKYISKPISCSKLGYPDVTGGMQQKVQMALKMAQTGAVVYIANGAAPEIITQWLQGNPITGTHVRP